MPTPQDAQRSYHRLRKAAYDAMLALIDIRRDPTVQDVLADDYEAGREVRRMIENLETFCITMTDYREVWLASIPKSAKR